MSVVNTMLRDLEARSGEAHKLKIPVRSATPERRSGVLLIGAAIVAAAALAWQFLVPQFLEPQFLEPLSDKTAHGDARVSSVPVVQAAAVTPVAANPAPAMAPQSIASEPAKPLSLHASWQWSKDGFALQLDGANDVRYGVERVDAGTLKISLSHANLAALKIPAQTPAWIDSARVQRDGEQQVVTVSANTRLEYDIAMLDGGALVISAWRDKQWRDASFSTDTTREYADDAAGETVAATKAMAVAPIAARISNSADRTPPRDYAKPRIDRSTLTPEQRDARQSAQAATQLRAGQHSQALSTLRAAMQSGDAAPKSAALLVAVLMSQQQLQEAQPYLDQALRHTPQDATLLKLKARMLAAQGDTARARAVLSQLSPATSADVELLALTASLAQQAQDFPAATAYYLQWTRIDPSSGAAWYGLALALDAQASTASAVAAYQHALTLINDARLREYATVRIAALQVKTTATKTTVTKDAAVAR